MTKGNNAIPKVHQRKHWTPAAAQKGNIKTFLDQPKKAQRRRRLRIVKAKKIFPRPLKQLRPSVTCPTVRYNFRKRLGRGFSVDEIKAAGIVPRYAATIGIKVDRRRKNISEESLSTNTQRLKTYLSKLILFPLASKGKATRPAGQVEESTGESLKVTKQDRSRLGRTVENPANERRATVAPRKVSKKETETSAYKHLKKNISAVRFLGERMMRAKKKEQKAKEAAEKKAK